MVPDMISERIVVVAPNWLGDAVMALPAVGAVRAAWPQATLVAAGRASTVPLFSMVPGIDEVIRLDSRGGIVGAISWAEDAAVLRGAAVDLAVLLPNSFRSAWTAQRAGIPERWGYAADLRGRLLTRAVPRLPKPYHMAAYYLHLIRQLTGDVPGVAQGSPGLSEVRERRVDAALAYLPKITPPHEAQERAAQLLARPGMTSEAILVGMAPGAAYGKAKQWPPERFAALAVDLHRRLGVTSLLFGARGDAKTTAAIARAATAQGGAASVIDLAGQTDLLLLVALMARCRSVVSNDSGAMHVAAAAGVPVTAIFGATNEHHTAPLPCEAHAPAPHEILTAPVWCRPCMLRECPIDHRCMRRIDAARVAEAVERQLPATLRPTENGKRTTEKDARH
jgi:heptosyltransferase-2